MESINAITVKEFQERWIRNKDVPALLKISARTWREIKRVDKIPTSRRGHVILIDINDINAWIEKNKK